MLYETFAKVYDEVMDQELYDKWLLFSQHHIPTKSKRILELACGTGRLAFRFAQAGYDVTALDLSEEMLSVASDQASKENVLLQFIVGDMQDLSEVGTYEVVTCFSDSLCYMENRQSVQQVFDEVYQILEEDGVFLFDVHSLYQIDEIFPEYSYHYQTDDFAFLWESYSGQKLHSIEHFLTFFIQDEKSQQFMRIDELHRERTYPLSDYIGMLESTGFMEVSIYGDFTDNQPTEQTKRWFFVCKK